MRSWSWVAGAIDSRFIYIYMYIYFFGVINTHEGAFLRPHSFRDTAYGSSGFSCFITLQGLTAESLQNHCEKSLTDHSRINLVVILE